MTPMSHRPTCEQWYRALPSQVFILEIHRKPPYWRVWGPISRRLGHRPLLWGMAPAQEGNISTSTPQCSEDGKSQTNPHIWVPTRMMPSSSGHWERPWCHMLMETCIRCASRYPVVSKSQGLSCETSCHLALTTSYDPTNTIPTGLLAPAIGIQSM